MTYDIIVIGSGLGGLTAGAKLAKEGKRVLLIEQHDRPGGCATTFKRRAFTMEVGLHEMDGLDDTDFKVKIFNDLDVFKHVEFLKVPEFYHYVHGKVEFTMPHNATKAAEQLKELFTEEHEGIDAYFSALLNAKKNKRTEKTIGEFLDAIIENDELKLILLGNLGYFHDDPYTLSLGYYLSAQSRYFIGGGNFIKGGSQNLSNYLASYIKKNGGKVLLNNMVTSVLVEDDKAVGVKYTATNNVHQMSYTAYASQIVANASIAALAHNLLPKEHGKQLADQIEGMPLGASLLTVYLGFRKPLKEIGSKHYSYFVYDNDVKGIKDIYNNNNDDFLRRSFTFVDYSQVDSDLAPAGKSVGAVCCVDYVKNWDCLSKEEYKEEKKRVAQTFIERLNGIIPGIKEQVEYYEVGTSKTVGKYILTPESTVYGFAQTPENVVRPKIKTIENLHLASAWTKIGGGFTGAICGGYMCAYGVLRKR